jgi:hypothetical protein
VAFFTLLVDIAAATLGTAWRTTLALAWGILLV